MRTFRVSYLLLILLFYIHPGNSVNNCLNIINFISNADCVKESPIESKDKIGSKTFLIRQKSNFDDQFHLEILENKNKALEEYAFITAHKLRAPLASILGLVRLVERMPLPEEDKIIVSHLNESAKRLDEVVHSVMSAIEDSDPAKQK